MGTYIAGLIILILCFFAVRGSFKHFKGEGGCCGGSGGVKASREKPKRIIAQKILTIDGMHCKNCSERVEKSINSIDGAYAKVNLKKKTAVICFEKEVLEDEPVKAVEKNGFKVFSIA